MRSTVTIEPSVVYVTIKDTTGMQNVSLHVDTFAHSNNFIVNLYISFSCMCLLLLVVIVAWLLVVIHDTCIMSVVEQSIKYDKHFLFN